MKKLFALILAVASVPAFAGTVPLYLSGASGASYVVAGTALVTTTNTSVTYTNFTIGITNAIGGTSADSFSVAWRGATNTFTFTNSATAATHIAANSNLTNQLFNILVKLQDTYPSVRVKDYNKSTLTISAPTDYGLNVEYVGTNLTLAASSYYDLETATESVSLVANPARLVTNTIVYLSSITTNGLGAVTARVYSTNTFVTSQ